jgi:large conductance mechanosensitive channel
MIQRARSFFRDSESAVATTVGVVGGLALYYLFLAIGYMVVLAILADQATTNGSPLQFTIVGVTFRYEQLLADVIALLLLSLVGYVLFISPGDESPEADPGTRDCPDCKSEIQIDARRCPYCTSVVPPIADAAD